MTDKERILMAIITRVIPGLMYSSFHKRDEYVKSHILSNSGLSKGDLVFANSSVNINDFIVGFVDNIEDDHVVIREIGSNRLCNYYNETFSVINKERLGYEFLEGTKYKTYQKVLKAFDKYANHTTKFKSISFDRNICTVQARRAFENGLLFEIKFKFDIKTTISSIGKMLEEKDS